MILKAVLIFLTALGTACVEKAPETPTNENAAAETVKPMVKSDSNENECRICDFDFENYKGDLNKREVEGLLLALNDEYMATAIYEAVNEKFDNPRPFLNIVEAEQRHAGMLKGLFETHKIPVPENPWGGKVPVYESVKAACEAGIKAEIVNKDLYDRLFKSTEREDILAVYRNLQRASEENHKPAFERCANGGGRGMGGDRRRGQGRNN